MQKVKTTFCLLLCLTLPFFLTAASRQPQNSAARVITDDAGRGIKLKGIPQRIVSLSPAVTEILFAIGAGERVVGVTDFCSFPEAATKKPKVGGFADINTELVVSLAPDVAFATTLHVPRIVPALEKLGIPVVINDPQTIAGVLKNITFIGQVTGLEKQAVALAAELEVKYQQITSKVKNLAQPKVFWELSGDLWTAGPGSFIDDLIVQAGGSNIAAGTGAPWAQLSAEVLIGQNPDFIFLADQPFGGDIASVSKRPGWDQLTAVVKKQLIEITDVDLFSRPGPRVMEALGYIARVLHPEVFE